MRREKLRGIVLGAAEKKFLIDKRAVIWVHFPPPIGQVRTSVPSSSPGVADLDVDENSQTLLTCPRKDLLDFADATSVALLCSHRTPRRDRLGFTVHALRDTCALLCLESRNLQLQQRESATLGLSNA